MRTLTLVLALTSCVLAQSEPASSLGAARELYASADYSGALDMLDRLVTANPSAHDRQAIDLYRTFCPIAMERAGEADEAIAAMTKRDPLYRPAEAEVPPRLRPVFSEKRRGLLPAIGPVATRHLTRGRAPRWLVSPR